PTGGRGFGCVFPQDEKRPIWVPARDGHCPNKGTMTITSPGSVPLCLFPPQEGMKMWVMLLFLVLMLISPSDGGFGNPQDARDILN
ncbi:hypothetical protein ACQP3D_29325, partial [Escherichia coli]